MNPGFLHFAAQLFWRNRLYHGMVFGLFAFLVFLLGSFLFLSESLRHEVLKTVSYQPDVVLKRVKAGRMQEIPLLWQQKLAKIPGVVEVSPRVYGYYEFEIANTTFTVMGLNLFLPESTNQLQALSHEVNPKHFLEQPSMLIGQGVKEVFDAYAFHDFFNFVLPDGNLKKVSIAGVLDDPLTQMQSRDMILMPESLVREIFHYDSLHATDMALRVPNDNEVNIVAAKVREIFPQSRTMTREYYASLFHNVNDYKSGIFLALFVTVLFSFILLLFQRMGHVSSREKKEIAIMRAVGWSIPDVMRVKIIESLFVSLNAFMLGIGAAYVYLYFLGAPLLKNIFLGFSNLSVEIPPVPYIEAHTLITLFLLSVVPYVAVILYPSWKIASQEMHEVLR